MELIATADSILQAEKLLCVGIDTLYIGNNRFGLRLPTSFSNDEIREISKLAHDCKKKVSVPINALMHNEHMDELPDYLSMLKEAKVDSITCGDPGVVLTLNEMNLGIPFIYDAQTLVTSAEQISFWKEEGAIGAVLARELTRLEVIEIAKNLSIPVEILVYGPTCIHQSKRKMVTNYYNIVKLKEDTSKKRGLYLREPNDEESMLPIFEDENGTHIFSSEDISLMPYLDELYESGLHTWKLDGILSGTNNFVQIAELFVKAKKSLTEGTFAGKYFANQLAEIAPKSRHLDAGFYLKDPNEVK